MAVLRRFVFADDGTPLFVRVFASAKDDAPTLMIVHGACEHGDRYCHVAEEIAKSGWRVIVPDLRGHGRSGGTRVFVTHFNDYLADLDSLHTFFALDGNRTAMLGHSMGGLIATRFAQSFPNRLAAIVLSSPLLRLKVAVPRTTLAIGKLLSLVAPQFRFKSLISPADVTRGEESQRQRRADPYIQRSITAGWFFAMKRAMREAWVHTANVKAPMFVVQAGGDRVVDATAARTWVESVPGSDRRLHIVPEGYHELFNEPDWRETIAMIAEWLDARFQQVPQGSRSYAEYKVGQTDR